MFYKHSKTGKIAILIVYMDDIFLTGDDNVKLKRHKKKLVDNFEIRDLGALKYFLGMEFARSKKSIFVDQHKYLLNLVVGMQSS
jgi:hypothetical protein